MKKNFESETVKFTRKNIKEAFLLLLGKKRFDKISVREIVHIAGYNRTTFYNYYIDTSDLLQEIENDILDSVDICFSTIFGNGNIEDLVENAFDSFLKAKEQFSLVIGENGDPLFEGELKRRFKAILRRFIKQSDAFSTTTEYTLEFYSSGLVSIIKMWILNEAEIELKDFSSVIINSINL